MTEQKKYGTIASGAITSADETSQQKAVEVSPVTIAQNHIIEAIEILEPLKTDASILAIGKLKGALEKLN